MNKQPSDEQIDQFIRALLNDAAMDDNAVDEIADSPKLWWGVQRQIAAQKAEAKAPWPPSIWRRVLLFAAPVAVATAVILSFFVFRPAEVDKNIATNPQPSIIPTANESNSPVVAQYKNVEPTTTITDLTSSKREIDAARPTHTHAKSLANPSVKNSMVSRVKRATEYKSEFIALSYARNAESGQIVRVKVPSSMMVSLGLVASVNKSSDLVDAEVIVGDDGLTRAIRFIRQ